MASVRVVKTPNEVKHGDARLRTSLELVAGREVGSQRAPKRFDPSVVVAVRVAAHALCKTGFTKRLPVFARRILDAAIRVMDEPRRRAPLQGRPL